MTPLNTPEWMAALDADDAAYTRAHQDALTRDQGVALLARAFSHTPFPEKLVAALLPDMEGGWLHDVMKQGLAPDWGRVLQAVRAHHGESSDWRDEMRIAARRGFEDLALRLQASESRFALNRMLLALLDHDPSLALDSDAQPGVLLRLAKHPQSSGWLDRLGLDVDDLLLSEMVGADHQTRYEKFAFLINTDEQQPGIQQATERLIARDAALQQTHQAWMDEWMAKGQWEGSALQQWCGEVDAGNRPARSPTEHPVFRVEGQPRQPQLDDGALISTTLQLMVKDSSRSLEMRVRHWIRSLRSVDLPTRHTAKAYGSLDIPPSQLGLGLRYQHPWVKAAMVSDRQVPQIQQAMALDDRLGELVKLWQPHEVLGWIVSDPSWQDWRDRRGHSLLGLVARGNRIYSKSQVRSTTALLKRLAKVALGLLTDQGPEGQRVLDALLLPPEHVAAIDRILLRAQAKQATGAGTKRVARPRM